jgi:hypothetical protein
MLSGRRSRSARTKARVLRSGPPHASEAADVATATIVKNEYRGMALLLTTERLPIPFQAG